MGTIVKIRLPVLLASDAKVMKKRKIRQMRASGTTQMMENNSPVPSILLFNHEEKSVWRFLD
jgi:hypothetical protein